MKKSYSYAQLEGVAQEMRKNKDMVFFYEYETPVAATPTGEILDLTKEFGTNRTSGHGWAIDETWIVGSAVGVAAAGSPAIATPTALPTIHVSSIAHPWPDVRFVPNSLVRSRISPVGVAATGVSYS